MSCLSSDIIGSMDNKIASVTGSTKGTGLAKDSLGNFDLSNVFSLLF